MVANSIAQYIYQHACIAYDSQFNYQCKQMAYSLRNYEMIS